jgi:hypothetical protein
MTLYCETCERMFLVRATFAADSSCPGCGLLLRRATTTEVRSLVAGWLVQNPRRGTKNAKTPRTSA